MREANVMQTRSFADLTVSLEAVSEEYCPAITLSVRVSNVGEEDAPASEVSVYAGDPSQGAARLARYPIEALAAGSTELLEFETPDIPREREITLYVVIDPSNRVIECNEDNVARATDSVRCVLRDGF